MTPGFACPNRPDCGHAGWYHDVEELGDPFPTCCVDGCGCGHRQGPMPEGQLPSWASVWERVGPISIVRGGIQWPQREVAP